MAVLQVEWILVIFYGSSAHRATYGRLRGTKYTKDYIQLSKKEDFINNLTALFPSLDHDYPVPIIYKWPKGTAQGELVLQSADRPHLKWETSQGAPLAWKMAPNPSSTGAETIPGTPSHQDVNDAERELTSLGTTKGAGQPYLMAVKLKGESETLHLRAYLESPTDTYRWASTQLLPQEVQNLAKATSSQKAIANKKLDVSTAGRSPSKKINRALSQLNACDDFSSVIESLDTYTGRELANYLRNPAKGLFFDPTQNHDAWLETVNLSGKVTESMDNLLSILDATFPSILQCDATAEGLDFSVEETKQFHCQIENRKYEVPDYHLTSKTRGSAQRAFSKAVKKNYGFRCAITGITSENFLVASHIVPWSVDKAIRLDPSNGICLSLLVDKAFESGLLLIDNELNVSIDWTRVGDDPALESQLKQYDGKILNTPVKEPPQPAYLQRRRMLIDDC